MSVDQIRADANAMAEAWREQLGGEPTIHALVLTVAQGTCETVMGRAWPGPDGLVGTDDDENNVGATNLRSLTAEELAIVAAAGIVPTVGPGHEARARAAEAAILAAGLPLASGDKAGIPIPRAHIHCDSRPLKGGGTQPYFVWFAAFGSLKDGCRYYLHIAAEGPTHARARAVLENPNGTEEDFAAALRAQGYYTGLHDNSTAEGYAANVKAYASWLRGVTPGIRAALAGWQPSAGPVPLEPPPVPPFDLRKLGDVQRALNALGCGRPFLADDGNIATKSIAALGFYQGACLNEAGDSLIDVTGKVDGPTLFGLARDLRALGLEVLT